MIFLVISQMLRTFVNTFTADEMYFLCKRENLRRPIQMELSKKVKIFPKYISYEGHLFFQNVENLN